MATRTGAARDRPRDLEIDGGAGRAGRYQLMFQMALVITITAAVGWTVGTAKLTQASFAVAQWALFSAMYCEAS
eukprot:6201679-Pleurochrysis_carterae.AAC.4